MKVSAQSIVAMGIAMSLAMGCSDATAPVAPVSPTLTAPTLTPPAPENAFPPLTHPGSIYVEEGPIYQWYYQSQGSIISRYVLYDDGTFSLQFSSATYGSFEYKGTYSISSNLVQFAFADRDSAGPWNATADLGTDEFSVTYNDIMGWADFVDGKYRKSPPSP